MHSSHSSSVLFFSATAVAVARDSSRRVFLRATVWGASFTSDRPWFMAASSTWRASATTACTLRCRCFLPPASTAVFTSVIS
ncbi:hypothetical protein PF006_g32414, partial [Phytophthora fragariae]